MPFSTNLKFMNDIKEELSIKLEKIIRVYIFAQDAYLYTEYFHNPNTKEELDLVVNSPHSTSLLKIMHLMFRTLIVEVSKLFSQSDSDKFQLGKFIQSLSPSGHFRKIGISASHIEQWQQQLIDNQKTIDNIHLLRSKLYAHTDNPMKDYNYVDISFKEIKQLLNLAGAILINIYHDIYQTDLRLDSPTFDRQKFIILNLLAKAETERQNDIFTKYNNWKQ
jgi:hypothetical protein